ncbi:LOW QUALITY PROTEIN: hypothetical protein HID58_024730, partial [Brassica napus]
MNLASSCLFRSRGDLLLMSLSMNVISGVFERVFTCRFMKFWLLGSLKWFLRVLGESSLAAVWPRTFPLSN